MEHEIIQAVTGIKTEMEAMRKDIRKMTKTHTQRLTEEWIDGQQVLFILNISKRKLQTLRDNGCMPYSRIDGKIFYKTADLERLLENGYKRR